MGLELYFHAPIHHFRRIVYLIQCSLSVQYVVTLSFSSLYCLIITRLTFLIHFVRFLVFSVFSVFVLFCILLLVLYIAVSFLFLYKSTDRCYHLETQLH